MPSSNEHTGMKKLFGYSNHHTKEFIEAILTKDSKEKNTTQSAVIEELLLKGIVISHPELLETARNLYRKNLDPVLIGEKNLAEWKECFCERNHSTISK